MCRQITNLAAVGGIVGALLLGIVGFTVASGWAPLPYLGQFAAAGTSLAVFAAAGIGFSIGALIGALVAVVRLPRRV
ncbi:hypothetical protein [Thiohalomonas denitrificans]|nr:hypothetical protein [Thiohalomonas denitrificans]